MGIGEIIGLALTYGPQAIALYRALSPEIAIAVSGLAPLVQKAAAELGHNVGTIQSGSKEHADAIAGVFKSFTGHEWSAEERDVWYDKQSVVMG